MPEVREGLSDRDVRELLSAVRDVSSAAGEDGFGRAALRASMRLVPCEVGTYNEVEAERSRVLWEPEGSELPEAERLLSEHQHEHPLIREIVRTGDGSPRAISDFLTPAQFHRLALYRLVFGPMGIEDQLAVGLPARDPLVIGIALNRGRRGFPARERTLLQLFRPHLVQARAQVLLLGELRRRLVALEAGAAAEGRGILLVESDGRFEAITPGVEGVLRRYFGSSGGRLPEMVARWLAAERGRLATSRSPVPLSSPLVLDQGGRRLTLRRIVGPGEELILASEYRADHDPQALLSLGLSAREADVLHQVAKGLTNSQIAAELLVSTSTVKRRLESIFRKLGVTSRAAAAAYAVEATAATPWPT